MTIKEVIIEFCESNELSYRTDYSGRCMYGRTCFGIVCDDVMDTLVQLCDVIRDNLENRNAYDELGSPRTDSLGLETILYFPFASIEMN